MSATSDRGSGPLRPRFHVDTAHRTRGRAALPFPSSPELEALVASAQTVAAHQPRGEDAANPYALQPDTLSLIGALLDTVTPQTIVEFGSGASTALFATWAAEHGASLISVEHDQGWVTRVRSSLSSAQQAVTDLRHAPLRPLRAGLRLFLTYRTLSDLGPNVRSAQLVLVDGPHVSGREPVIWQVLSCCRPGTLIVVDDCRHYAIREMLLRVGEPLAQCFSVKEVDDNSHGLCILRCERATNGLSVREVAVSEVLRSYWRCLRDFRQHGTGA